MIHVIKLIFLSFFICPVLVIAAKSENKFQLWETSGFFRGFNFKELGVKGLDNEIMWRGFMVKKGTPKEAYDFYMDLFEKVNKDPKWREYIQRGGATPVLYKEDKFLEIVKKDQEVFTTTLKELGAIK